MNLLMALGWLQSASAFCGTYVGGVDSEFYNSYSQLAVVRKDSSTTLTIVNDIEGSFDDFALVIPIPEVIPEENLKVLDPTIFERLDAYSQPRLVSYECEDFETQDDFAEPNANGGSEEGGGGGDVNVEALYIVGEFEIVILSAEQSSSLFTWLNDNGYSVPGQSLDLLQEYITGGSYFLAAKVSTEAGIESGDVLSPLQMTYSEGNATSAFSIPIRIGTLNAKDAQDLVIYSVSDYSKGRLGISNYPEFFIEDECLWIPENEQSFGEYYSQQFSNAYAEMDDAAWTVEYAWGGGGCDPCSSPPPDAADLISLGMDEEQVHYSDFFFTRLHARYTPQQVDEELMLYQSNLMEQMQYRFIEHKPELEDRFPVCGIGMVDDPGSCDPAASDGVNDSSESDDNGTEDQLSSGCQGGCSTASTLPWSAWFVGLLMVLRRRQ